jgi:Mrp family chromosome partitioning ATPase
MALTIDFDSSLTELVCSLERSLGTEVVDSAVIVRDATGYLSAVLVGEVDDDRIAVAELELRKSLGRYARQDALLRSASGLGAARLLDEASKVEPRTVGSSQIRLLDRRVVGADWLTPPAPSAAKTPRIVFWSLKGGVGRSTALCVIASHLSRLGRRVLAIDFDLEAPGIGTMLLTEAETPPYGTLDYLVESGIGAVEDLLLSDMVGNSSLGSKGARVAVVPAVGQRTLENPQNALSKLARAYIENVDAEGRSFTLSQQLSMLIDRFDADGAFDVVLVDARAGLHESAAAAISGLGADVLLFGVDQPQTYLGYRLLLSHLAQFKPDSADDWRDRLRFVEAKASIKEEERRDAIKSFEALYEIVAPAPNHEPREADEDDFSADDFVLVWDDDDVIEEIDAYEPPQVTAIIEDGRYRNFDPLRDASLLEPEIYQASYSDLLGSIEALLDLSAPEGL